jgi:hypothetical protein
MSKCYCRRLSWHNVLEGQVGEIFQMLYGWKAWKTKFTKSCKHLVKLPRISYGKVYNQKTLLAPPINFIKTTHNICNTFLSQVYPCIKPCLSIKASRFFVCCQKLNQYFLSSLVHNVSLSLYPILDIVCQDC